MRRRMIVSLLMGGVLAASTLHGPAMAQETSKAKPQEMPVEKALPQQGGFKASRLLDVEWKPGPFPGSQVVVMAGDPKSGMHHTYLKLSDGAYVAPHWHSTDEYATVVSGTILFATGAKAVRSDARLYGPGAFLFIPAKTPHYAWAKGDVVLSQTRSGALDVNYLNPDDNPNKPTDTSAGTEKK